MPPEAYSAAAEAVKGVNSSLQMWALVFIAVAFLLGGWLTKVDRDSKKLIAEKEKGEKERTAARKAERDAQINAMGARLDNEINKTNATMVKHLEDHKALDNVIHDSINKLDVKLTKVEDNMHSINVNIAEIRVRMEMGETEKKRHEPKE